MLNKLLLAGVLSAACTLPALAQSSSSSSATDASSTPSSNSDSQMSGPDGTGSGSMTIRQHLKQDLMKNGLTDIQVMPTSFFVRAKDKNGHRVMMMIGPDSVTTFTNPGMKMAKNKSGNDKSGGSDNGSGN